MFTIETEFYKRKVGIREVLLTFFVVLFLTYFIFMEYFHNSAAYYLTLAEKVNQQERELMLIEAKQAEIHNSIKKMQDEIRDN
jgi:cell division protein FtsB